MAKGTSTKAKDAAASNGTSDEKKGPPAGFRRRGAVAEAPWFKNVDGNTAHGKLLGRYIMNGVEPPRPYYQVELYAPCSVTVGKGEDAEVVTADAGDVVNLGEAFKMECLREVEIPEILAGGEYDLWVEVEKKIKIGGGRTMWVIDVQSKRTKSPTGEVRPLPPEGGSKEEGEADSPF